MNQYSDAEEVEKLKSWWKTYGNALIIGVMLGVALLFGNKYWENYRQQQREAASEIYENIALNSRRNKEDQVRLLAKQLMEQYASTPYAGMAALILARKNYEKGDLDSARRHLSWAVENATVSAIRHTARLRLGRVLLEEDKLQDAYKLIGAVKDEDMGGFKTEYYELRGDIHKLRGENDMARTAYDIALKNTPKSSGYYRILAMKRDDVSNKAKQEK